MSHEKRVSDLEIAQIFVMSTLDKPLQMHHENMFAHEIFDSLKALFSELSHSARYRLTKRFFDTKMTKGRKMDDYVLMMKGYIDKLSQLNI